MADDISAPLPDISWPDQAIILVDAGDPAAKILGLRIHLSQDVPQDATQFLVLDPLLTYGPGAA